MIRAHVDSSTGYGQIADWMGRSIEELGISVVYVPVRLDETFLPLTSAVRARLINRSRDPWELLVAPPQFSLDPSKATVVYTMWETTRLPPGCVDQLNLARGVIVPSRWCADIFSANGVVAPLFVVSPGVDEPEYFATTRSAETTCRFGTAGRLAHGGPRKGVETVITAFQQAFPNERDVLLSVKIWPDCDLSPVNDPRITLIRDPLTTAQLGDWFRSLTAYVSASCGEGFGLLPLQAMACGRPAIATPFSGHSEYLDDSVGYPLQFSYQRASGIYMNLGHWGVPDLSSIIKRMRQVYENRSRAAALGADAAIRAKRFTWRRTGQDLIRILQSLGALSPACASQEGESNSR